MLGMSLITSLHKIICVKKPNERCWKTTMEMLQRSVTSCYLERTSSQLKVELQKYCTVIAVIPEIKLGQKVEEQ
jgi:hypothetical protein